MTTEKRLNQIEKDLKIIVHELSCLNSQIVYIKNILEGESIKNMIK